MAQPADRFFDLLPVVVRAADAKQGNPLRDLLRVMGEQAAVLEDDIRQMYQNLFIETCEPWVIAYLGDLVGYRPVFVPPSAGSDDHGWARLMHPRSAVADRIALSRRKGTFTVLSDLVESASGWPARIEDDQGGALAVGVGVFRLPSWPATRVRPAYQPRLTQAFSLSVLDNDAPLFTPTISSAAGDNEGDSQGDRACPERLTVDMLADLNQYYGPGRSLCLFENGHPIPAGRIEVRHLDDWDADPVGEMIAVDPEMGRVMFPERYRPKHLTASYHYGFAAAIGGGEFPRALPDATPEMSFFRNGHLVGGGVPLLNELRTSASAISQWLRDHLASELLTVDAEDPAAVEALLTTELNKVMQFDSFPVSSLDPDLPLDDEMALLLTQDPRGPMRIRLNRLLLEAWFPDTVRRSFALVRVTATQDTPVIMDAIRELQNGPRPPLTLVLELADSGLYVEPLAIDLRPFHTLVLRASDGCRPTILVPERGADIDDLVISCGGGTKVVLDGLMIGRRAVRVTGNPMEVTVRQCTLVPGWALDEGCSPTAGTEASLVLSDIPLTQPWESEGWSDCPPELLVATCVHIDRSILGSIQVQRDEVDAEPARLELRHSILDATARDAWALAGPHGRAAHANLTVASSTIVGVVRTNAIELAEDSIFFGQVEAARRQVGCIRYSYVPPGSRTPRRFACQPDLAVLNATQAGTDPADAAARVEPRFMDPQLRYGRPDYARLDDISADPCANEILRGAEDESEMGVFHTLYHPQRLDNVRGALREFLPLGWTADITLMS